MVRGQANKLDREESMAISWLQKLAFNAVYLSCFCAPT
jgi:hypothetical protein